MLSNSNSAAFNSRWDFSASSRSFSALSFQVSTEDRSVSSSDLVCSFSVDFESDKSILFKYREPIIQNFLNGIYKIEQTSGWSKVAPMFTAFFRIACELRRYFWTQPPSASNLNTGCIWLASTNWTRNSSICFDNISCSSAFSWRRDSSTLIWLVSEISRALYPLVIVYFANKSGEKARISADGHFFEIHHPWSEKRGFWLSMLGFVPLCGENSFLIQERCPTLCGDVWLCPIALEWFY